MTTNNISAGDIISAIENILFRTHQCEYEATSDGVYVRSLDGTTRWNLYNYLDEEDREVTSVSWINYSTKEHLYREIIDPALVDRVIHIIDFIDRRMDY